MQARTLQKWWIMLRIASTTLKTSLAVIARSSVKRLSAKQAQQYLQDWSGRLLELVKTKPIVVNPHNVNLADYKHCIIMANHASHYDIPVTFRVFPDNKIRMIAKKELFGIPFFGQAMQSAEFLSVDRNNRKQAVKDLEQVHDKMEQGIVIWMAPEGTRSLTGELGHFKKGGFITAIKSKATIVPIAICGANKILPAKSLNFHLNQRVEVRIGKPVDTAEYTLQDKEQLIQKVHGEIEELLLRSP